MTEASRARLLIVDDEALQMKALCDTLEQEGYITTGFTSANDALEALRDQEFDLLLTDLMMPEMDGIDFLRRALEIDKTLVGIVMTGQGTVSTAVDAMKIGALDYILKPFKLSVVTPVISRALRVRELRMDNIQLLETVAIYELSMAIAFACDSAAILRKVVDAVFQQGDASCVSALLPAPDGKELYVAAARGQNADSIMGKRFPLTDAISAWVSHTQRLFSSREELDNADAILSSPLTENMSGVSIPLVASAKLMGILNFSPVRPHRPPPPGRIKTLSILAGTAASALHSVSLLEELRNAEQRYRLLADNAPDMVFRYELLPNLRCVYMSPAVTELTGHVPDDFYRDPELWFRLVSSDDRSLLEAAFRGECQGATTTVRWAPPGRAAIWVEQRHACVWDKDGRLAAIEGIARDITERRALEEQLRQAQRMEAVGRLAAGVAHDFNNLLTVINGYCDLILSDSPLNNPTRTQIEHVRKAGDKATALTRQLLAFGRKQVLQPRVLNVNEVVQSCSNMLGRVLGEDIELVSLLHPSLGAVKADAGQLEQVLMNLAVNSRDAMPMGGKLTIETCNVILDEAYIQGHIGAKPGPYVAIVVSDTGSGMDAATRSQIFEPFFTTKEIGRGTGLGLSIVYGIIKQSGGDIWVYSEPGKGTTFKIYLPRTEEESEANETHAAPKRNPGGSEAVLVVEDDEAVRELTCAILQGAGYGVIEANDAEDALKLLQERQNQRIGLVLTDLVMPGMSGLAMVEKLKQIRPGIKVLYTSGYSDEVIVRHGHLGEGLPFIQKPFGSGDLLRKIREVLDLG